MECERVELFVECVERFTHKNNKTLLAQNYEVVKLFVRSHEDGPKIAFQLLLKRLKGNNSQSGLLSFQLLDYLFMRSKIVREQISKNLRQILILAIGYEQKQKLPQPPQSAWKLRSTAVTALKRWNQLFGEQYPQIRLGLQYLEKNLNMVFPPIIGAEELEQQEREQQRRKETSIREYWKIDRIYERYIKQLEGLLKELNDYMALLQDPKLQSPQIENNNEGDEEDSLSWEEVSQQDMNTYQKGDKQTVGLKHYGVFSDEKIPHFNEEELEAKETVAANIRDLITIFKKEHIPKIQRWLRVTSGAEIGKQGDPSNLLFQSRIRELVEKKSTIVYTLHQAQERIIELEDIKITAPDKPPKNISNSLDEFTSICKTIEEQSKQQKQQLKFANDLQEEDQKFSGCKEQTKIANNIQNEDEDSSKGEILLAQPVEECSSRTETSRLNQNIRNKLLQEAPRFPSGFDPLSQTESLGFLNPNALDVYNHWGPVDKDARVQEKAYQKMLSYHATFYNPIVELSSSSKRKAGSSKQNVEPRKRPVVGVHTSSDPKQQRRLDREYNESVLAIGQQQSSRQESGNNPREEKQLSTKQRLLRVMKK